MRKTVILLVALVGCLSASLAFADDIDQVRQHSLQDAVHALNHQYLVAPEAFAPAAAEMEAAEQLTALEVVVKRPYVVDELAAPLAISEKMAAYVRWGNDGRLIT